MKRWFVIHMHVWKITQRIVVDWIGFSLPWLPNKLWRYLVNFLNVPIYITKQQAPSKVHRNTIISFIAEANKQIFFPYFVRLFDFFFLYFILSWFCCSLFRLFLSKSLCNWDEISPGLSVIFLYYLIYRVFGWSFQWFCWNFSHYMVSLTRLLLLARLY